MRKRRGPNIELNFSCKGVICLYIVFVYILFKLYKYYILIVWELNIVFDVGKVLEGYEFLNVMWLNDIYYIQMM